MCTLLYLRLFAQFEPSTPQPKPLTAQPESLNTRSDPTPRVDWESWYILPWYRRMGCCDKEHYKRMINKSFSELKKSIIDNVMDNYKLHCVGALGRMCPKSQRAYFTDLAHCKRCDMIEYTIENIEEIQKQTHSHHTWIIPVYLWSAVCESNNKEFIKIVTEKLIKKCDCARTLLNAMPDGCCYDISFPIFDNVSEDTLTYVKEILDTYLNDRKT
jgi:hypothetical protein